MVGRVAAGRARRSCRGDHRSGETSPTACSSTRLIAGVNASNSVVAAGGAGRRRRAAMRSRWPLLIETVEDRQTCRSSPVQRGGAGARPRRHRSSLQGTPRPITRAQWRAGDRHRSVKNAPAQTNDRDGGCGQGGGRGVQDAVARGCVDRIQPGQVDLDPAIAWAICRTRWLTVAVILVFPSSSSTRCRARASLLIGFAIPASFP